MNKNQLPQVSAQRVKTAQDPQMNYFNISTFHFIISLSIGTEKKIRANVGELERKFILQCYNLSMGKDWKQVLLFTKERILDAGLPQRVVQIYIDSPQERVINRMKNIVKKVVSSPLPSSTSASSEEQAKVQNKWMKYASKGTPAQRKLQKKLRKDFTVSSSGSSSDDEAT